MANKLGNLIKRAWKNAIGPQRPQDPQSPQKPPELKHQHYGDLKQINEGVIYSGLNSKGEQVQAPNRRNSPQPPNQKYPQGKDEVMSDLSKVVAPNEVVAPNGINERTTTRDDAAPLDRNANYRRGGPQPEKFRQPTLQPIGPQKPTTNQIENKNKQLIGPQRPLGAPDIKIESIPNEKYPQGKDKVMFDLSKIRAGLSPHMAGNGTSPSNKQPDGPRKAIDTGKQTQKEKISEQRNNSRNTGKGGISF